MSINNVDDVFLIEQEQELQKKRDTWLVDLMQKNRSVCNRMTVMQVVQFVAHNPEVRANIFDWRNLHHLKTDSVTRSFSLMIRDWLRKQEYVSRFCNFSTMVRIPDLSVRHTSERRRALPGRRGLAEMLESTESQKIAALIPAQVPVQGGSVVLSASHVEFLDRLAPYLGNTPRGIVEKAVQSIMDRVNPTLNEWENLAMLAPQIPKTRIPARGTHLHEFIHGPS